ncbi:MAG: P-loop NTPase fold protein, partial [bacterium]|nr:P-loop NTPase fold protein [bacterium]MDE0288649.1 P-loop NTPase fold protein [bacterium]MDE0440425.1 P-loop NTPase fold protein [bacterium]
MDRLAQVGIVTGVLSREAGPAVVIVNAPWGGGKTTFLKMCAAELQDSDVLVVEFNSWTQQYTTKPLLDLVGAISYQIQTRKETRADSDLKEFAEPLADVFGRSRSSRRLFASWDSTHESVRDFSTALSDVARQRRIVLLVDELDRCRADYALGTLEALRHLFLVEGVLAVVGVSRDELCHSIRSLYGERFDADAYLRRFADLQIDLPPPTHQNMTRFLERQLQVSGLADRQPGNAGVLQLVTEVEGCSLRDLQQATHLAALALLPDPPDEHPRSVWEQSALAMIVLPEFGGLEGFGGGGWFADL